MSGITSGVGLASGVNIGGLVDAIINAQRGPVELLGARRDGLTAVQTGLKTVEAFVLSIKSAAQSLGDSSVVDTVAVSNSDNEQLVVSAGSAATAGTHYFRTIATATSHAMLSKGFANTDTQTVGAGSLVLSSGGAVTTSTPLELLNGGVGVRRGTIRITDRDGNSADVDLSTAYDVDDVLDAINGTASLNVTAVAAGDKLELTDSSTGGGTFSVVDLSGGSAAADLGIAASTTGGTITGSSVYSLTSDFTLELINDGNTIRRTSGGEDIRITLTDDTILEINLDDAATLGDVVDAINNHADNGGKAVAALSGGALQITDASGGGGSSSFTIEDINNANVVEALGLDNAESGGVITGDQLLAGLNSVLLRNLNGGTGVSELGSIDITDRSGGNAVIDLSAAVSLADVVDAINADGAISVTASINDSGTGLLITDTSGGGGNLIVADVATGTAATDLNIAGSVAADTVDSGSLNLRYVNAATTFADLLPSGVSLGTGSITITDSAGNSATVDISGAVDNIGDVIDRINAASGISVTAALNDTGDGLVVIDEAGDVGTLTVVDTSGTVAATLGLDSTVYTGSDSKQRISGRTGTTIVDIDAADTLQDVVDAINASEGYVTASIVDTGSAINPFRIQLDSKSTGASGRFLVQSDGGLELDPFATGEDAILRVGSDSSTGFLRASSTNSFDGVATGLDVTVLSAAGSASVVTVERDVAKFKTAIESFVSAYNQFVTDVATKTEFDLETNTRGILQGETTVLRVSTRLDTLVNDTLSGFASSTISSLSDLGVRVTTGGKLEFDTDLFDEVIASDPTDVTEFFLREDTGFAAVAETLLDGLTDSFTGSFKLADTALQNSVDSLENRILDLEEILVSRRERLFLQFVRMEQSIALLQSQQQSLGLISPISVAPAATGASSSAS